MPNIEDTAISTVAARPLTNGIAKPISSSLSNRLSHPNINAHGSNSDDLSIRSSGGFFVDSRPHQNNELSNGAPLPKRDHIYAPTPERENNDAGSQERPIPPSQTPVLIIGGGPAGLLAAILLAKAGICSIVLERHAKRLGQPKAHALNPRSLEILHQAGLDTKLLRKLGASPTEADAVRFVLSVSGLEVGSLPYERQDDHVKSLTPEPLFNIPQPILEEYLWKVAKETRMATFCRQWQWQDGVEFGDNSIVSKVMDRQTNTEIYITSKYLLGCDGAHARSRARLEIPFNTIDGLPPRPIHYCSVNIDADMTGEKSGMLWFIMTKNAGKRNFIAYDRASNWVFVTAYDPAVTPPQIFTEAYCRSLIDESVGKQTDYKVLGITLWSTTPQVAKFYRSRKVHNGLIAGDAAHCFPSTGGLGINTGIGDVHNLIWKILAVEKKWASDCLLDTYETERIPIALANSMQSRHNEANIHRLGRAVFGDDGKSVQQRMADSATRREIEDAIMNNYDHFDSLDLQLGYVYGQPRDASRSVGRFNPVCVPGARLPHAWVASNGQTISTLDLARSNVFTLFTSKCFVELERLQINSVPIEVMQVGRAFTDEAGSWTELMGLAKDVTGVLVRPDQHILATVKSLEDVVCVLQNFLHRSPPLEQA